MAIVEDIKKRYGRESSVASIYMTLKRLQTEGLIRSKLGTKTNTRGGRRKQIYSVQGPGRHYLRDYYNSVSDVWHDLEHYLAEHRFI
jgi:DNA-binding PadR family transcriptional regulator